MQVPALDVPKSKQHIISMLQKDEERLRTDFKSIGQNYSRTFPTKCKLERKLERIYH